MNQRIEEKAKSIKANRIRLGIAVGMLVIGIPFMISAIFPKTLVASDHDDGETDTKGRNLNLTDLYVFRESEQNPRASSSDLILIMNTNPRSVARQQYYFSSNARYEFKIARVNGNDRTPTGLTDIDLSFEFSAPNANQQQRVTLTAIRDGRKFIANNIFTTPIKNSTSTVSQVLLDGSPITIFAGLKEDPFFFDVEQYFRVRAGALGIGPAVGFRNPSTAIDFAKGYNVNAIAVRVPIRFLRGATSTTTFDVWTQIQVRGQNGRLMTVERLARPAINEGLIFTNDLLNTLNAISPQFEARALQGIQPEAAAAAPVVTEAIRTLKAFGNSDARANTLINAFLPDVMRIDTSRPSGYGTFLNANGSPAAGRLLKDDVIDTTITVITGSPAGDNVSYEGTPGNAAQGHKPLETVFPYLAPAN